MLIIYQLFLLVFQLFGCAYHIALVLLFTRLKGYEQQNFLLLHLKEHVKISRLAV